MLPVFKTMRSFHRFVATFKVFIVPPVTGLIDVVEFTRNSGVFKGFLKAGDVWRLPLPNPKASRPADLSIDASAENEPNKSSKGLHYAASRLVRLTDFLASQPAMLAMSLARNRIAFCPSPESAAIGHNRDPTWIRPAEPKPAPLRMRLIRRPMAVSLFVVVHDICSASPFSANPGNCLGGRILNQAIGGKRSRELLESSLPHRAV